MKLSRERMKMYYDYVGYKGNNPHPNWLLLRRLAEIRSHVCEVCFTGVGYALHHITYDMLCCEPMRHLLRTCKPCHGLISGQPTSKGKLNLWEEGRLRAHNQLLIAENPNVQLEYDHTLSQWVNSSTLNSYEMRWHLEKFQADSYRLTEMADQLLSMGVPRLAIVDLPLADAIEVFTPDPNKGYRISVWDKWRMVKPGLSIKDAVSRAADFINVAKLGAKAVTNGT